MKTPTSPPQELLNMIVERFQKRQFDDAEKLAVTITREFPQHQFGWRALGAILGQTGRYDDALVANRKAVALSPGDAEAHSNLGATLKQLGRLEDAEGSFRQAISLRPDYAEAHSNLGATLKQLGRLDSAEESCKQAISLKPDYAEAHSNLGFILQAQGRLAKAESSHLRAITLKPDFAEAHSNMGVTLQALGRLEEAEKSYKRAIALKPDYAEAHGDLGVVLQEAGRLGEAEKSYKKAISLRPEYAQVNYNLGVLLQQMSRLEEAEASYKRAIDSKPDYAEAYLGLTSMKKMTPYDVDYLKMLELYDEESITKEQRCHINFGLAKAFDDFGRIEQAFFHYGQGNALRKELLGYDISQDINLFSRIKSQHSSIKKFSLVPEHLSKKLAPIFIVGMPRSGTTLVEQIVSSHPQVTGAGELPFVANFGFALASGLINANQAAVLDFRQRYLTQMASISDGNWIVTDKMPQNFCYLGLIFAALPEAKIIHVKRDPAAVCWANYKQYFSGKGLGYSYALEDVVRYFKLYEDLMTFWKNAKLGEIYELDYERLVENQENEIRQLVDYLGLGWSERFLLPQDNSRRVTTASNLQVRKKIYRGSSQRWKRYESLLKGAFDGLSGE